MQVTSGRWSTHWDAGHNWALVLAAGEGSRLQALTTTAAGISIPKQFCSLEGGSSLLHNALARARIVAPPQRICAVVAGQHARWWQSLPNSIPAHNIRHRIAGFVGTVPALSACALTTWWRSLL